ncbi:MAG: ribosome maturation factor RimM [Acidimicrobiia bacterium]|nr:MAG: ribosome maturation factor RimM [Acidimicrobiia bacterium]
MSLVDVGYGRRAHGIGGEVVVRPQTDDPDRWVVGATFTTDESPPRTLEATAVRTHHDDLLVRFAGIDDRDAADTLRGTVFQIPATERRPLGDGEFWPDDLIGAVALGPEGETLGTVTGIELAAAQDRLVIETADGSRVEVPFVSAIVPTVDVEARVITVTPPDGLF